MRGREAFLQDRGAPGLPSSPPPRSPKANRIRTKPNPESEIPVFLPVEIDLRGFEVGLRNLEADADFVVDEDGAGEVEGGEFGFSGGDGDGNKDGDLVDGVDAEEVLFGVADFDGIVVKKGVGIGDEEAKARIAQALQEEEGGTFTDLEEGEFTLILEADETVGEGDHLVRIDGLCAKTGFDIYFFGSCHNCAATRRSSLLTAIARRFSSRMRR